MKQALLAAVAVVALLLAIAVVRAAMIRAPQAASPPAATDGFAVEVLPDSLERFSRALQIPTISHAAGSGRAFDAEAFLAFHRFLETSYPLVHATLEREMVSDYGLLYTWPGTDTTLAPVVLLGHFDVVPVDPDTVSQWTHPPFAGRVADGHLWGRGAIDDKINVIGLLEGAEKAIARGFVPARTLLFSFGHDEELGGPDGAEQAAALVASRFGRVALVVDEGGAVVEQVIPGLDAPVAAIGVAEKGYVSVELSVETAGGHSSAPPAHTAIGTLATAIHRLEREPMPTRFADFAATLEAIGPHTPLRYRVVLANLWLFGPLLEWGLARQPLAAPMLRTTTAATLFHAGVKDNVLPSVAEATVNFRVYPGDSIASVVEHVIDVIDDPAIEVTTSEKQREPSAVSNLDSPGFEKLSATIRRVYPSVAIAPFLIPGGTDARHFRGLTDAVFGFMPVRIPTSDLRRAHGTDERIPVESFYTSVRFYAQLIHDTGSWRD